MNSAKKPWPWPELLFLIPIISGYVYVAWYFHVYGYLPQPYFYEPGGVFMDFFSVSTYSHGPDAFNVFGTIYPPLSFAFAKYITWAPCYVDSGLEQARDCDWMGLGSLYLIFAINAVLIFMTYRKIDKHTYIPRSIAMAFGLPMTYTLERGNLLIFTFTCVLLAYGPLLKSARWRWVYAGLAVNFKIYLIGTLFAQLLRRRWRWFEGAVIATILIYLVSYAIYGEGTPKQIYDNITLYAGGFAGSTLLDLWYPSSFVPARTLLEGNGSFNVIGAIGSRLVEFTYSLLIVIERSMMLAIAVAAVSAWWRPQVVPMYRLIFFSICMAILSSEVGGYTQIFMALFVFMEPWRGFGRKAAILMTYVLAIPLDIPFELVPEIARDSWLSNRSVISQYAFSVGIFARPILLYLIALTLALVTIADVFRDMRAHGWRCPWPGRRGAPAPAPAGPGPVSPTAAQVGSN
jgi:hypothetical protein